MRGAADGAGGASAFDPAEACKSSINSRPTATDAEHVAMPRRKLSVVQSDEAAAAALREAVLLAEDFETLKVNAAAIEASRPGSARGVAAMAAAFSSGASGGCGGGGGGGGGGCGGWAGTSSVDASAGHGVSAGAGAGAARSGGHDGGARVHGAHGRAPPRRGASGGSDSTGFLDDDEESGRGAGGAYGGHGGHGNYAVASHGALLGPLVGGGSGGVARAVAALRLRLGGSRSIMAVLSCVAWAASSNGLIVVNKVIMTNDNFRYPMALSSLGMLASSVCSYGAVRALGLGAHEVSWRMHAFRILPVGFLMAVMFYFGNLCYLYISLAYIQMLKTGSPILTMCALALAGLEMPSVRLVAAVLLIAAGTAVTSLGELHFSWLGFFYMLLSQLADSARLVMTQVLLTTLKFHPLEGLMHLSPACTLCLWAGTSALELPEMRARNALGLVAAKPGLYFASAIMGFFVNVASLMVIKYTGSLTLKLLGAVSNALLVVCAAVLFGDELSLLEMCGYVVSLGGFVAYNLIKLGACGPEAGGEQGGGGGDGAGGGAALAAHRGGGRGGGGVDGFGRHESDASLERCALLGDGARELDGAQRAAGARGRPGGLHAMGCGGGGSGSCDDGGSASDFGLLGDGDDNDSGLDDNGGGGRGLGREPHARCAYDDEGADERTPLTTPALRPAGARGAQGGFAAASGVR